MEVMKNNMRYYVPLAPPLGAKLRILNPPLDHTQPEHYRSYCFPLQEGKRTKRVVRESLLIECHDNFNTNVNASVKMDSLMKVTRALY